MNNFDVDINLYLIFTLPKLKNGYSTQMSIPKRVKVVRGIGNFFYLTELLSHILEFTY